MNEHDDLERRLRAALTAKAEQITEAHLDLGREAEVVEQLRTATHSRRRIFTGVGIAAAAAAIVGVGALAIQPGGQAPVNAASHLSSGLPNAGGMSAATADGSAHSPSKMSPQLGNAAGGPSSSTLPTETSSVATGGSMSAATAHNLSTSAARSGLGRSAPPELPTDLPQAGPLGTGTYAGPVPITDASGGATRMLNMPDGTEWQVVSHTDTSLTVRITDLPADVEAYWTKTLPGLGWVPANGGWRFPQTSYAVSAVSNKGAFTVSW